MSLRYEEIEEAVEEADDEPVEKTADEGDEGAGEAEPEEVLSST